MRYQSLSALRLQIRSLVRYSFDPRDKCNACNCHPGQAIVVRHKKVGSASSRTGKLHGVGRSDPLTASNLCISLRGFQFEFDQFDRALGKEVEVTLFEDRVARFSRLCKRFSEGSS